MKRGGAYVEACIRGGSEFGPSWHQAALKENRNKAYEDFIAVGEDVCASGLCTPGTLAARGGSNGGLLMGNMSLQGKDLWCYPLRSASLGHEAISHVACESQLDGGIRQS